MKSLPTGTAKMLREVGKTPAWWQWKRASLLGRCVHPVGLGRWGLSSQGVRQGASGQVCAGSEPRPAPAWRGSGRLLLSPVCPSHPCPGAAQGSQVSGQPGRGADPHHQPPWPQPADGTSSDLSAFCVHMSRWWNKPPRVSVHTHRATHIHVPLPAAGSAFPGTGGGRPVAGDGSAGRAAAGHWAECASTPGEAAGRRCVQNAGPSLSPCLCVRCEPRPPAGSAVVSSASRIRSGGCDLDSPCPEREERSQPVQTRTVSGRQLWCSFNESSL